MVNTEDKIDDEAVASTGTEDAAANEADDSEGEDEGNSDAE